MQQLTPEKPKLVSKHESTYRLLLLFMSTGDKETLGTLLSHFLSLHPELPVYCDAVFSGCGYIQYSQEDWFWVKFQIKHEIEFCSS